MYPKSNQTKIIRRIEQFLYSVSENQYCLLAPLEASYIYNADAPIPYESIQDQEFKKIEVGEEWGKLWGSAWFKFHGTIPPEHKNKNIALLLDVASEGCVWEDGCPAQGITHKIESGMVLRKRLFPIDPAKTGDPVDILLEAGANGLFGTDPNPDAIGIKANLPKGRDWKYTLTQAEIVSLDPLSWKLFHDLVVLIDTFKGLPEESVRSKRLLFRLNQAANLWDEGKGISSCLEITAQLLSNPASFSSLTAYSIGHAHIDLAWLWPIRETKRKGGRTFSTALKLIEEYPEYKFGASQPQLYQWIKEDYPKLFQKVKNAVKEKRWECQGVMWVEPDMNLPAGESLVRQCLYGKGFFRKEFGVEVKNFWIPDTFGYSAALPQILKQCGVEAVITQKISWNDTNTFPHHTFYWKGIDGTEILTHFLPTNDYNFGNKPQDFIEAEKRFEQSVSQDSFLNLYGPGDGGGGPARYHIELGKRQQNLEGTPRFKFAFAQEFIDKTLQIPKKELPKWEGELYLELHRGTYTTQAKLKKYNRSLELKLRDVEFLCAVILKGESYPQEELEEIWKETLLNQFHDILPGSSINWVYKDAHALSEKNLARLEQIQQKALDAQSDGKSSESNNNTNSLSSFQVWNTLSWSRKEHVTLPGTFTKNKQVVDSNSKNLDSYLIQDQLVVLLELPPMGYNSIHVLDKDPVLSENPEGKIALADTLENQFVRIQFSKEGTISSIFDKTQQREILLKQSNQLLLWEDKPNAWDAWDVDHYYRETTPEAAKLTGSEVIYSNGFSGAIRQTYNIGLSEIRMIVSLEENSKLLRIESEVDWRESRKMLRTAFHVNIRANEASYEIQFGTAKRSTQMNHSWDLAKFEVCGHRFMDFSEPDYGVALINDCKYGFSIIDQSMEINLLRSPKYPDPEADMGLHSFCYGIFLHSGSLADSDTLQIAHNFNSLPIVHKTADLLSEGTERLFFLSGNHVKIETIKRAESGQGNIVRLYETMGTNTTVALHSALHWNRISEVDLLENIQKKMESSKGEIELHFKPFEIRSFLLE